MTLDETAFVAWCARLGLSAETQQLVATIRSSPPARKVKGRVGNVSGRYPSPKMGRTIQFESHHVELWAIYAMERDDDVLEFYDQPEEILLRYRAKGGKNTGQWHHPDFFVLRQHSAGYEEWKPASVLEDLGFAMPGRYRQDGSGVWTCPPGVAFAQPLGLTYQVRSSSEYHPRYIENLRFLQDYWAHPHPGVAEQEDHVLATVAHHPGISVADLLDVHPAIVVDMVWELLAIGRLFTDFTSVALLRHEQVPLYATEIAAIRALVPADVPAHSQIPSPAVIWQQRLWLLEQRDDTVVLHPEFGESYPMAAEHFHHLLHTGAIRIMTPADPTPTTPEIRQALDRASPKAQREANRRMEQILAYLQGEPLQSAKRTVQRWYAAYQAAEERTGSGYLGLLDRVSERGNRTSRAPEASKRLLEEILTTHYATPQAKRGAAVYALYRHACEQQHVQPVTERTFYRARAQFTTQEVTIARHGRRAAYRTQPFVWTLEQTTPRHGERPWAIVHLDHTELDVELVSSVTGKPLGRPWATLLIDAYSRRILAVYVTFDAPSYRSAMMVLRRCVQRHHRLPQDLVVDRGTDFGSVYFETFLARYFITKKERPAHQPRFGSLVERIFGTATTEFLNQLLGNTQASKTARQMTKAVNPKRLAVWTLERFAARLEEWAYSIYDQMDHPMLGQSPAQAYEQGMRLAGQRMHRMIAYDEEFLMLTRPTTHTGHAKVNAARGITVNALQYWNASFRLPGVAGTQVSVRYEPFDMGVAYAYVQGQWLECIADGYGQVHGRSEREWRLILEEWHQQQRVHGQQRSALSAKLLAPFLESVANEERILSQQLRDLEAQAIREAIDGIAPARQSPAAPLQQEDDAPVDFDAIPVYEEYR